MRIHYLQHVDFEDLANIESWATNKQFTLSRTLLHRGERLPELNSFDWLIIMGGPMGIYDYADCPWLKPEKEFIHKAIANNKKVLGICLGAQLIADVLGGPVTKNKEKEIGWWPAQLTPAGQKHKLFKDLPKEFMTFQWHGDTFAIPPGAIHLASSPACAAQAFSYQDNVLALQFHLESSAISIKDLTENCGNELVQAPYIQTAEYIKQNAATQLSVIKNYMERVLERL